MKIHVKTINLISLGCLVALLFVPWLAQYVKVITFYPLLMIWGATALWIDHKKLTIKLEIVFFIYVCALYFLIFLVLNSDTYLRRIITVMVISYSSLLMYYFYSRHLDMIENFKWFVLVCLAVGFVTTIPGLIQYPRAARVLATDSTVFPREFALYKSLGIGGYEYIYTLVVFAIFLPSVSWEKKKKLIFIALMVLTVFCVFLSGYTTAILMVASFPLISYFLSRKNGRMITKLILIAIVLVFVFLFLTPILKWIAELADKNHVYYVGIRLNELLYAEEADSFSSLERVQLYQNAFQNFLDSPLIGAIGGQALLKSGHSELLYYLETFGLLGAPYIVFLILLFRNQVKAVNDGSLRSGLICCQVFFVIFAFINRTDVAYSLIWAILFIIPLLARLHDKDCVEAAI